MQWLQRSGDEVVITSSRQCRLSHKDSLDLAILDDGRTGAVLMIRPPS